VTLGMNTKDGWVEVRSGIAPNDLLVVRGAEALSDGAKVRANRVTAASLAPDAGSGESVAPSEGKPSDAKEDAGGRRQRGSPAGAVSASVRP
jgi:multidrug efflux system membrane fusion protein